MNDFSKPQEGSKRAPVPPVVSVIIPAYNAEGWIARAIRSVLRQTVVPAEIIVVDDGSTDSTAATAEAFGGIVRVICRSNGGPAAARNTGIRAALGNWFALLDADDSWLPTKLAAQLPLTVDPAVGVVHARKTIRRGVAAPPEISFAMLWEGNCVLASSVMIRRECFEALAGFDEDRGLIGVEDYNFWLRATRAGWKVATYQEWLVKYTPAPGSLSRNQSRLMEAELVNAGKLAAQLGIAPDAAQRKRCGILRSYAEDFLFARNMGPARACHWKLVRQQPTVRNLVRAVGVMLPPRILDLRRGRPAPQSQEPATPPPRESGAAAQ